MSITICTWNINSVRLREGLVQKLLREEAPDVLCLQEIKAQEHQIPLEGFAELGWTHHVARGQKSYNGVMILSRLPIEDAGFVDWCEKGDARHVAARLENGVEIGNFYIPAGGDEPDPEVNEKFAHKLQFLDEMKARFSKGVSKSVIVGDFNIAPREDDVWSHKQLLKVISHTPIEVEKLAAVQAAGDYVDTVRALAPEGKLYSWWSYRGRNWEASDRGRRLDHIWATSDIADKAVSTRTVKAARGWEKPSDHAPVFVEFDLK